MSKTAPEQTTRLERFPLEPNSIVNRLIELDAQYQGNVMAANREEFIREHLVPIVRHAIAQAYSRGYIDHAAGR